jgi:hypothetical protein
MPGRIPELGPGDKEDLLLCFRLKVSVANVSGPSLEAVQFCQEHKHPDAMDEMTPEYTLSISTVMR